MNYFRLVCRMPHFRCSNPLAPMSICAPSMAVGTPSMSNQIVPFASFRRFSTTYGVHGGSRLLEDPYPKTTKVDRYIESLRRKRPPYFKWVRSR